MSKKEDLMTGLYYSITSKEIERRHRLLQAFMEEKNLGVILVIRPDKEGYSRWLTGEEYSQRQSDSCLVMMKDGELCQVIGNEEMCEFIETKLGKMLWVKENQGLGIIHSECIRKVWREKLDDCLPEIVQQDVSVEFMHWRAVKSPEEQQLMGKAAQLVTNVMEELFDYIKPGMLEREVVCYARYLANHYGSGGIDTMLSAQIQLVSWCGKQEVGPFSYPGRRIAYGDMLLVKLRILGDSGFYGTLCRCLSLGEPREADRKMWEDAVRFQKRIEELLIPGNSVEQIVIQAADYAKEMGIRQKEENWIHGIGYCITEVPLSFGESAKIPLKDGMIIVLEPVLEDESGNVFCCGDMYQICEGQPVRLTETVHGLKITG